MKIIGDRINDRLRNLTAYWPPILEIGRAVARGEPRSLIDAAVRNLDPWLTFPERRRVREIVVEELDGGCETWGPCPGDPGALPAVQGPSNMTRPGAGVAALCGAGRVTKIPKPGCKTGRGMPAGVKR